MRESEWQQVREVSSLQARLLDGSGRIRDGVNVQKLVELIDERRRALRWSPLTSVVAELVAERIAALSVEVQ